MKEFILSLKDTESPEQIETQLRMAQMVHVIAQEPEQFFIKNTDHLIQAANNFMRNVTRHKPDINRLWQAVTPDALSYFDTQDVSLKPLLVEDVFMLNEHTMHHMARLEESPETQLKMLWDIKGAIDTLSFTYRDPNPIHKRQVEDEIIRTGRNPAIAQLCFG